MRNWKDSKVTLVYAGNYDNEVCDSIDQLVYWRPRIIDIVGESLWKYESYDGILRSGSGSDCVLKDDCGLIIPKYKIVEASNYWKKIRKGERYERHLKNAPIFRKGPVPRTGVCHWVYRDDEYNYKREIKMSGKIDIDDWKDEENIVSIKPGRMKYRSGKKQKKFNLHGDKNWKHNRSKQFRGERENEKSVY